jgi:hypothetical protein
MALQMMATGAAISTELALIGTFAREMGQRLGAAITERAPGIFDPYHPELHYMARNGVRSMASPPAKNTAVGDGAIARHERRSAR